MVLSKCKYQVVQFAFLLADVISYGKYGVFKQSQDITVDSTKSVTYNQLSFNLGVTIS